MRYISIFSLFTISLLFAGEDTLEIDELFLQTLNEASEIAMHDKLNIEKIPSTVTVIRRDIIEASGAKTLLDILELVPGIEISMSSSGKRQIIIRGMRGQYRDKLKLLIDGVDVTNNLYSNQFYYYMFPASLIKRVEVTKTPDAILYGSNAFMGAIHVVTMDKEFDNQISTTVTSEDRKMVSLFQTFKVGDGDLKLDAHYSYFHPDIMANDSMVFNEKTGELKPFREPTPAHTKEKSNGMGISYKRDSWFLNYRLQQYTKGSFFGITNVTPLTDDKQVKMTHNSLVVGYDRYIKPELKWHIELNAKRYIWDGSYRTMPYDLKKCNDPNNDLIMGAYIDELETSFMTYLRYSEGNHNLVTQVDAHYSKPLDMYYMQYIPSNPTDAIGQIYNLGPDGKHLTGEQNILKEGIFRKNYSFAVEDLYDFGNEFSMIAGGRIDYYNGFNSHFSYKLGLLDRIDPANTLKILFNHTFRAPSWVELYAKAAAEFHGNEELENETMDMLEINWLKNITNQDILKFNIFYGVNSDPIVRRVTDGYTFYDNGDDITVKGFEVEYKKRFGEDNEVMVSISHHADYSTTFNKIENDTREDMIKLYLNYWLLPELNSFTQIDYGSSIEMPSKIEDIDSYINVSETLSYNFKNFTFKFGVKNIFDEDIYYLSLPTDLIANKFRFVPENARIPSIGREWFISLEARW